MEDLISVAERKPYEHQSLAPPREMNSAVRQIMNLPETLDYYTDFPILKESNMYKILNNYVENLYDVYNCGFNIIYPTETDTEFSTLSGSYILKKAYSHYFTTKRISVVNLSDENQYDILQSSYSYDFLFIDNIGRGSMNFLDYRVVNYLTKVLTYRQTKQLPTILGIEAVSEKMRVEIDILVKKLLTKGTILEVKVSDKEVQINKNKKIETLINKLRGEE